MTTTSERAHVTTGAECWCLPLSLIPEDERRPEPLHSLIPEDERPEPCREPRCRFTFFREGVLKDEQGEVTFSLIRQDLVAMAHTTPDGKVDSVLLPIAWLDDLNVSIFQTLRPWFDALHGDPERVQQAALNITEPVFFKHRLYDQGERPGQEQRVPTAR